MKSHPLIQAVFLVLLLIFSAAGSFLILFETTFSEKIYPRVDIAGQNIGNLNPKIAQKSVENRINAWKSAKVRIRYEDANNPALSKNWQIEPEDLGITPNAPKNILAAYNTGRTGNIFKMLQQKITVIAKGENASLFYELDEDKFASYIENNFSFLEKPGKDASLAFIGGSLKEIPAQNGYAIDQEDLRQKISANIQSLKNDPVIIKMLISSPKITNQKIENAKKQAAALTEGNISLRFEDKTWILDKNLVGSSLKFPPVTDPLNKNEVILGLEIDPDLIDDKLEKIQLEINREPSNAVLGMKDGKIIIESGGETGAILSVDKSVKKIIDEMRKEATNNNKNIEIRLITEEIQPAIGKKTLEDMKIDTLIGQGKSNFSGSPQNRRRNIAVGAAKFNNIFIADGEEFSFVKILGEISAKNGYLSELVIKENSVVEELGGGLCQVSTTAFRAAIYSGLPILERKPHSYPVAYYNPQGMDATIYPPHPDLRFKNDTGGIILIQTKIIKNELIFNFFGTKQSRKIKIIGPNIYDSQPDGSMKTVFWREFYDGDTLLKKEPFYSVYSSPSKFPHKNPLE